MEVDEEGGDAQQHAYDAGLYVAEVSEWALAETAW